MKIKCKIADLSNAVFVAQKAVSSKSVLTLLEGILFSAKNNKILLMATDNEMGIDYYLDGEIIEEGEIVVNAKMLGDLVRKLPNNDTVTIEVDDNNIITFSYLKSFVNLVGLKAEQFPHIDIDEDIKKITLQQFILKELIKKVVFSVSVDDSNPILKGCLIETSENSASMVSIDGYRMSYKKEYAINIKDEVSLVIPGRILSEISKLISDNEDEVIISFDNNKVLFDFGKFILISRLIHGEFIDYKKIIPDTYETTIFINTKNLLNSIERASLVIHTDNKESILFNIDDMNINVSSLSDLGNADENILIEKEGKDIKVAFNPKYLIDALKTIEDEKIKFSFSSSVGPAVIEPLKGDDYLYLLLPVRI